MHFIRNNELINELKTRGIGFEREEGYCVDVLQAAYLTEIGKCRFDEAVEKVNADERLKRLYAVFKDLRRKMHVANYVEKDGLFLVYEKGMVPKKIESSYAVKVVDGGETFDSIAELCRKISASRKVLVFASINDGKVEYYKFQRIDM